LPRRSRRASPAGAPPRHYRVPFPPLFQGFFVKVKTAQF
jgi:hypothetical protein